MDLYLKDRIHYLLPCSPLHHILIYFSLICAFIVKIVKKYCNIYCVTFFSCISFSFHGAVIFLVI